MLRIGLAVVLILSLLAVPLAAEAQQPTKVSRIGFLSAVSAGSLSTRAEAFRHGLRELGYVEGKNIVIEWRFAEGKLDRLPSLANELVNLKVDLIVSGGPAVTRAAKAATSTIPIVMTFDDDPVASGVVASLARPGGNITGLSTHYPEISGKQLELLKEIAPTLSRVAILWNSSEPGHPQVFKETELAARALVVQLQSLEVRDPKDIDTAFRTAAKGRADAVLVMTTPILFRQRMQVANLAIKSRLPAIFDAPDYVEDGGLMAYGANIPELYRRAATYMDKILRGTQPADLPVEQPTKFEMVINLKTAKALGITIPQSVLGRADHVIE